MERQKNPRPWFSCPESAPRSKDQDLVLQAVQRLHTGLVPGLQRLFTKSLRREVEVVMLETAKLLEQHGHTVVPFAMHHPQSIPTAYVGNFVSVWLAEFKKNF